MELKKRVEDSIKHVLSGFPGITVSVISQLALTETRKEFEGDYTLVVFPLTAVIKKNPEQIATEIGTHLMDNSEWFHSFNVVKGFLNLKLKDTIWIKELSAIIDNNSYWKLQVKGIKIMVEYGSPNTNKPLHLGHVRNILLGSAMSRIMEANGYEVIRTQVINDRGIAICKSMLAWKLFGEGKTPKDTGIKADHFVGDFYVLFEQKFQEEYLKWQQGEIALQLFNAQNSKYDSPQTFFKTYKNTYFNEYSELGAAARDMLLKWEEGDHDVKQLWETMNAWVYEGFEATYRKLGIHFDQNYYESDTYLLGKSIVEEGLETGLFYRKEDNSVWVDLEPAGLDQKVVLRADGTSVYITQDIGTAEQRFKEFGPKRMVYVVADEQNYHFQVLFEILKRMGVEYADGLYHLSYGMVELPEGKMKSREGTVVDADDLINDVLLEAHSMADERGELNRVEAHVKEEIISKIGLGALKYFMLKVQSRRKMLFDPKESVDMQGNTGPYIQNAFVRIQSIIRKLNTLELTDDYAGVQITAPEKELLLQISAYPEMLAKAAEQYDPSEVANYCYQLAKSFHRFYHECPIVSAADDQLRAFRASLASCTATALKNGMNLLGIDMPERM